ncbi:hypothetical protein EYZ11_002486 [Aspergillus tanneri]|uniref:Uncharacterized protein n=1 Tax=Aspergillus tanneri TaxID=1220188 RepID=A0A4S3JRG6_9EURO|nr:hypothetical protein EYZ11_002486 [Aspergillus tanneri]
MGWVHNASPQIDAQSNYQTILGVCFSLTALMVVVVSMRLYLRLHAQGLAADDYVMIVTMVFSVIYNALCVAQSRYGLGLPLSLRPKANLSYYTRVRDSNIPLR